MITRVLTLAIAGGIMLSAPMAPVAFAANMIDPTKCEVYQRDLKWDLMLVGEAGANYAAGSSALDEAGALQESGQHKECYEKAISGIEALGLPVNSYPE